MKARIMRGTSLEITRNKWKIATELSKNLKSYKRFEDLEVGVICRLEGYQCQSEKLEDLVELTEKAHKLTLK